MKVFLGSSGEATTDLDLLAEWVEGAGHEPIPWTALGVFAAGGTTLHSLADTAKTVDAAVFIFSEDDDVTVRANLLKQPRDNVLIEYGLFWGVLGARRVIFCRKGHPKSASDLGGITYIDISPNHRSSAKRQVIRWLESLSDPSMPLPHDAVLAKLQSPFQASGKRSLFLRGTEMLRAATTRIALVARTPVPIVGTRPYGDSAHVAPYEKEQLDTFWNVMSKAAAAGSPEIKLVACSVALEEEVKAVGTPTFKKLIGQNIARFASSIGKSTRSELRWNRYSSSLTYLVADNDFVIWFKDGTGDSVWITASNDAVSDALYHMSTRYSTNDLPMSLSKLIR